VPSGGQILCYYKLNFFTISRVWTNCTYLIYTLLNRLYEVMFKPLFLKLWSAGGFEKKKRCRNCIVWMKNTPVHVWVKTAFVSWPSTESNSFHNVLSFDHYFRKYFKLVYRKNVVVVTLTTGVMFLLFTGMHFRVWGILQVLRVCSADRLWSGPQLPNVWETLVWTIIWSTLVKKIADSHTGRVLCVYFSLPRKPVCRPALKRSF
jgi:hypothetical protein